MKSLVAFVVVLGSCWIVTAARAAEPAPVKVLQTLELGGEGRWDYLTADGPAHRLYVTRSSHVQVVDLTSGQVVADWPGTDGVHGVAIVHTDKNTPGPDRAFVSCGKANAVAVFDLASNRRLADVPVGKSPDSIVYDPASACVIACNHSGGSVTFIAVTPGADGKYQTTTVDIGGKLEAADVDGAGRAYVDVEDKNEVAVLDTKAKKVITRFPVTGGEAPSGVAIDAAHHRLFVGCGDNRKMVILDTTDGHVLDTLPIGDHNDGCGFDPTTGRAYASCGEGMLAVITPTPDGHFTASSVKTEAGARTIAVDTVTGRIYLPTAEYEGQGRQAKIKDGTFHVLVVGAK